VNLTAKQLIGNVCALDVHAVYLAQRCFSRQEQVRCQSPGRIASCCHLPLPMGSCQYRENMPQLMDGCMMVVDLGYLLCIAVENAIDRAL
jgi:hypothetical protein